ncbi:diguanylate cyclase [Sulfurimonas sp.]|uniref:diguanylate cyclase n=1 Tax=Sulfurimonas sp. TaxID=2022749 RepID=UPI0026271523|nr:diguanylate cyclase [Sulfurimonas sp.]
MQFIEALRLRSKLFILFMLIAGGLFSVGIMGTSYINAMKKNIDSLYFGSLIPITELNNVLETYHNGLGNTVYRLSRGGIPKNEAEEDIENSLRSVNRNWQSYMSHFKTEDELLYVNYANSEIISINNYFKKILNAVEDDKLKSHKISVVTLERRLSVIHQVLQKLISYEIKVANYERKTFLTTYDSMVFQLGAILGFIILAILSISLYVFRSIQNDQTKLELASKKLKIANKKLESASYTDSLTTLHNRRYFNFIYEKELKRTKRNKNYITFMMIDIDFFKQYNDTYGHVEGDFALKSVAKVLKDSLRRPSDYVFRLGGEEFGVLLSETDESHSARLARDICDAVRAREIKHGGSKVNEYLTISIGLICCKADDNLDGDLLISRADEMLYRAKESGRDRYIITTKVKEKEEKKSA